MIKKIIPDSNTFWLIEQIIKSFKTEPNKGLPLGNVTSQLFANIYLNELDQFVKHSLGEKYYIRYCDDSVILDRDKKHLAVIITQIQEFLVNHLNLTLHFKKIIIRKLSRGIDFLGYIVLPHYIVLRTKTKRRMFKKMRLKREQLEAGLINEESFEMALRSYLGMLKHCKGYKVAQKLKDLIF